MTVLAYRSFLMSTSHSFHDPQRCSSMVACYRTWQASHQDHILCYHPHCHIPSHHPQ